MQVKCISRIHDVYYDSIERSIEESRPKPFDSETSQENNVFNQPPYSLYDDDNEIKGSNIKGDLI